MGTQGLLGKDGIIIDVGINNQDIIFLCIGIFAALVLAGTVIHVITKNL